MNTTSPTNPTNPPNSQTSDQDAPPTFSAGGRLWTLRLTFGACDAVADATGVDLMLSDGDAQALVGLCFDTRKLAAVLWALVARQAETAGVTRGEFFDDLDGEALCAGQRALVDAVLFFSRQAMGETRAANIRQQLELANRTIQAAVDRINQTLADPKTSERILAEMEAEERRAA